MPVATKVVHHIKKFDGKTITYNIYTQKEATELGIIYKYWKDTDWQKFPCYVEDDEGLVGIILSRIMRGLGNLYYYHSPWGNLLLSHKSKKNKKLFFIKEHRILDIPREPRRKFDITTFKKVLVYYAARGLPVCEICDTYKINTKNTSVVAHFLETVEYEKMLNKEMDKVLKDAGLGHGKVVTMYQDAYEIAKTKKDAKTMAEISDRLATMLGMNVKTIIKQTQTTTNNVSNNEIASGDLDKLANMKGTKTHAKEIIETKSVTATSG